MNQTTKIIEEHLLSIQDISYRDFHSKLMPTIEKDRIIGIRVPVLRAYAKEVKKNMDVESFFNDLPHYYYEENNLHAFIIAMTKDFDTCLSQIEAFLPYIDNWATCDQISPCIFQKNKEKIFPKIVEWCSSGDDEEYKVRFSIRMMMNYFLDSEFSEDKLYII